MICLKISYNDLRYCIILAYDSVILLLPTLAKLAIEDAISDNLSQRSLQLSALYGFSYLGHPKLKPNRYSINN